MPTPPGLRYIPLKPRNWPQDDLRIPAGHGVMSRVDPTNRKIVGREYYQITTNIINIGAGATQTVTTQTPNYGDFVCATIATFGFRDDEGELVAITPYAKLQITDVRSGYQFFKPYARYHHFIPLDPTLIGLTPNNLINPSIRTEIPQPYYFTRDGAIEIFVQNDSTIEYDYLAITLGGWLEYQHVSR